MNTKQITFQGQEYTVPDWVKWVVRNASGSIVGYQWEPFELCNGSRVHGYYNEVGMSHTIFGASYKPVLERV